MSIAVGLVAETRRRRWVVSGGQRVVRVICSEAVARMGRSFGDSARGNLHVATTVQVHTRFLSTDYTSEIADHESTYTTYLSWCLIGEVQRANLL